MASGSVGPFFYIEGKVLAYKVDVSLCDSDCRFFDADMSHFWFFDGLGIDGDYGNYPRGRVLYDTCLDRFVVYLDKALRTDEIKKKIIREYGLPEKRTGFRLDDHYTHDGL